MESKYNFKTFLEAMEKTFKPEFEKGTDIGFQMDEIKKTSTEDLLILRSSIVSYLKSKKLKKRNANYMGVFLRINQELSLRKKIPKFITTSDIIKNLPTREGANGTENKVSHESFGVHKNSYCSSAKAQKLFDFFEYEKNKNKSSEKKLLNRKFSLDSHLEIDIPSFFNDKYSLKIKKLKETLHAKEDEDLKNSLKDCSTNFSEFGKGLFNEKLDLDLSEDHEPYQIDFNKSRKNTDVSIFEKEIEINGAIFDSIPEDMFFSLD